MKKSIALLLLCLSGGTAQAHPGVGIVQDSRGNVFFTDLKQVWKVAPGGKMSVAVPNVHTHELCLDPEDNLCGEHLWSGGGGWRHRVWCLKGDGSLIEVIPDREGFPRDYSFTHDLAGNMYFADPDEKTAIKKRSSDGKITTHATADFRTVQRMTATPDGTLFLMDGADLRRVSSDGKVATIATNLSGATPRGRCLGPKLPHGIMDR